MEPGIAENLVAAALPLDDLGLAFAAEDMPGFSKNAVSSSAPTAPSASSSSDGAPAQPTDASSGMALYGPLPDEDLSHWLVSPSGYVRHVQGQRDIGRLNKFKTNITMACYMHAKCSIVRASSKYTKEYMLSWLVAGRPCSESASGAERRAEGDRHRGAFRNL